MKITKRQLRRIIREEKQRLLNESMQRDPHGIIGMEVRAADGGNYGHRVLDYDPATEDYTVQAIRWTTGDELDDYTGRINVNKITYKYDLDSARPAMRKLR